MPDADDIDVEYLRSLLRGGGEKKEDKPPLKEPVPGKKKTPAAAGKPASKGKKKTSRRP